MVALSCSLIPFPQQDGGRKEYEKAPVWVLPMVYSLSGTGRSSVESSMGCRVDVCCGVVLHRLQEHNLHHHGLLHGLQRNLCSGPWNIFPSFFARGVCRRQGLAVSNMGAAPGVLQKPPSQPPAAPRHINPVPWEVLEGDEQAGKMVQPHQFPVGMCLWAAAASWELLGQ